MKGEVVKRTTRGTIIKRYEKSFTIILDLPRDPVTGKRKQKWVSFKGTPRQAEKRLAELAHEIDTGTYIKPSKLTVADWLRTWLASYAAANVRKRTLLRYEGIINRHIIPSIGAIPLAQLQPAQIKACYTKSLEGRLDGKPGNLSTRSLLQHHRVLRQALDQAVKDGLILRNPAQAVPAPRAVSKEMNVLDADGVRAFLGEAVHTDYYALFHLAVYTGLRRSELLGLRWSDVNLDMATLSVVRGMQQLPGGEIVFLEPKTAKGRRAIALSPSAVIGLREHRRHQEDSCILAGRILSEDDQVFSRRDGTPLKPDTISQAFSRISRCAGLIGIRFHDLRHTHASLLLQQGIHPKIVQERLGHATIAVTLDTYSHVLPGLQEAAALAFEKGLHGISRADVSYLLAKGGTEGGI